MTKKNPKHLSSYFDTPTGKWPAAMKSRLKRFADELWSHAVYEDWGFKCAMCGERSNLNAHHLHPRQVQRTRYVLRNGICLCVNCHQYDTARSPHQNAGGFVTWLMDHYPSHWEWYCEPVPEFGQTLDVEYYLDVIHRLKEHVLFSEYVRICGVKLVDWLEARKQTCD